MAKVELSKLSSLTFYKDEHTAARRTSPLPQLVCVGKPCRLFQPEVVRCTNLGGYGTEVEWKCDADLPDSLRFGKVEVSCEGWSKPGDPYVLKGSCSLNYRLLEVPGSLRDTDSPLFRSKSNDWPGTLFTILWLAVLGFIVYSFFQSCIRNNSNTSRGTNQPGSGTTRPQGWFPGDYRDDPSGPPPPYSKTATGNFGTGEQGQGWRPGFWTGAALGGLANHFWNRTQTDNGGNRAYDWERYRTRPQARPGLFNPSRGFGTGHRPAPTYHDNDDRGEGSSNLGSMRRSTGYGGSTVR